ncbi:hypothetical protein D6850_00545 [Roseovarius spongiae]|uniref:Uncharacterized protein n=1 Tax=Roseovarius spongiae TaxID=2320272 RepID=A0A3A8AWI3_9RHOB|nr:hypothetical protein D6850_00545 [Roseovarius spongiae]
MQGALARAKALRRIIQHAENQLRRDAAIITYTRLIDDLIERLHALNEAGVFERVVHLIEAEPDAEG